MQATAGYDVEAVRRDFPILQQEVHGKPLVYLDNAATTQKPRQVLDALQRYYEHDNANIHRGVHTLSERATRDYEAARAKVAAFIHAPETREVIFTRGTTEGINLVAQTHARSMLRPGDAVVVSEMEHHSNIVPWQMVCQATGATLRVIPVHDDGTLDMEAADRLLDERAKLLSIGHVSNALGTVNPVRALTDLAKRHGATVVIDGAQATPHIQVDVQAIGCDFYAFSGHKMYGPTGIGALWGRADLLEAMPPYQGGGEMIRSVRFTGTTYNEVPHKFEAGTPDISGAIGLGAAIDYLQGIGLQAIAAHEHRLLERATAGIREIPGVTVIGTAPEKAAVLSFTVDEVHPHDIGSLMDREGVAIRTGHHCAQPIMERFGLAATSRASFGLYNTEAEVDHFLASLAKVRGYFL